MMTIRGLVFDIQRFCVHDGPGIRTTVFLKGCSLRCFWCQNPEGISINPVIMYYPSKCINCGQCVLICPKNAHIMMNGKHEFLRNRCDSCGKCVEKCYSGALQIAGKLMSVDEVMVEVLKDRKFYEISGGGVTLSGGDPVIQYEFSKAVLRKCKAEGLHTAIETAANCSWKVLEALIPFIDIIIMDIKLIDNEKHKKVTGVSNTIILENAKKLSQTGKPLIIRTPIIPTVNDNIEAVKQIAEFIAPFPNLQYYELIPFHRLGEGKYHALGLEYAASGLKTPSQEKMAQLAEEAKKYCIKVKY